VTMQLLLSTRPVGSSCSGVLIHIIPHESAGQGLVEHMAPPARTSCCYQPCDWLLARSVVSLQKTHGWLCWQSSEEGNLSDASGMLRQLAFGREWRLFLAPALSQVKRGNRHTSAAGIGILLLVTDVYRRSQASWVRCLHGSNRRLGTECCSGGVGEAAVFRVHLLAASMFLTRFTYSSKVGSFN
jgi:hypothetical protein